MKNCAIETNYSRLGLMFKKNQNYSDLVNYILDSDSEGYFFNIEEIGTEIKENLSKREGSPPFSIDKFISTFYRISNRYRIDSSHDYFSKPMTELYDNANESMRYMENTLENKLVRLAFIDPSVDKLTVTLDNSVLNANIQEYKNDLFKSLCDYLKEPYTPLYVDKRFNKDSNYHEILDKLSDKFIGEKYTPDVSVYGKLDNPKLKIFNNAVILANFDSLVESKFNNIVSVNPYNKGSLNQSLNTLHYGIEFKGLSTTFWKESSHSEDAAEKYSSDFMKMLSGTIPLLDINGKELPDQSLGMKRIYLVAGLVKEIAATNKELPVFHHNPKGALKEYLKTLSNDKKLTYKATVQSLYRYLYHPKTGVVGLIEGAKKANPDAATSIIDIEGIIAHQLNNCVTPIYGIYSIVDGEDEKRVLNLLDKELKGDEIRSKISKSIIDTRHIFRNRIKIGKEITIDSNVLNLESTVPSDIRKIINNLTKFIRNYSALIVEFGKKFKMSLIQE